MTLNNFEQRTISGIVYVSIVVASILLNSILFGTVFGLITMLAIIEYNNILNTGMFYRAVGAISGGILFAAAYAIELSPTFHRGESMIWLLFLYLLVLMTVLICGLYLKHENPIKDWNEFLGGQWMIAFPFAIMNCIMAESKYYLLSLFILIWINDAAAYIVGSLTAKLYDNHKMFPRVSPGKSWEGLIGGAVFTIATVIYCAHLGWFDSYLKAAVFGLVVVVFGTFGDLMESLMKRTLGLKDSGKFMPGHGGVLDRFDSLLLATPAVWVLINIFKYWWI